MRVAKSKLEDDDSHQLQWSAVNITKPGKMGENETFLRSADQKDVKSYEVWASSRVEDRMKRSYSSVIQTKRRGDKVMRLLHCEHETIIGDRVDRFFLSAISQQKGASIQRGVYSIMRRRQLARRRTMTRETKVAISGSRGALTTNKCVEP